MGQRPSDRGYDYILMRVFHVKVVEVHVVRCYSTENDARTLFPVHTRNRDDYPIFG